MDERLYSDSWYRIAALKPRLRGHARVHRHRYRGRLWYVVENTGSGKFYRLAEGPYVLLGLMDGTRTVQEIWDLSCDRLGDAAPTQDQTLRLLGRLHGADVILCDRLPNIEGLERRRAEESQRESARRWLEPFCWRIPLLDPERALEKLEPLARVIFSRPLAVVWALVVALAALVAAIHWQELTEGVLDRLLGPDNLIWLCLLFPLLKIAHELGHALAIKSRGGHVREVGIMVLALAPLPYVDASASSAFAEKRHRILVGAAGMLVEVLLASLALLTWSVVEPGPFRATLYNVIAVAGVSTLVFNANPLLRFDGYYMLADAIEIPNLSPRSRQYLLYLVKRFLLGVASATDPATSRGERLWFAVYGGLAVLYRYIVVTGIILFVSGKFFFVGVLLALWGAVSLVCTPVVRAFRYVFSSPELNRCRGRALRVSGGLSATALALVCVVPAPQWTVTEGVVVAAEEASVRAGTDGFVTELVAEPGSPVKKGDALIVCEQPSVQAAVRVLEAELAELEARRVQSRGRDLVKARILEDEIGYREKRIARERERLESLTLRSRVEGTFVVPRANDLPGRFVATGTLLAHVLGPRSLTIRVVVPQKHVDRVRHDTRQIALRLAERPATTLRATMSRELPAAASVLPSPALGRPGGGRIATDPTDEAGTRSVEKYFQFELELESDEELPRVGGRAFVRFDHGWEPIALRWYRGLRRLFLGRFHV